MQKVSISELKQWLDKDPSTIHLLDVRETYEHEEFNIGGTLIPVGDLPMMLEEVPFDKADRIVVYCRSGMRSSMAQMLLTEAGYTDVWNLDGGVLAWQEMVDA